MPHLKQTRLQRSGIIASDNILMDVFQAPQQWLAVPARHLPHEEWKVVQAYVRTALVDHKRLHIRPLSNKRETRCRF